MGLDVTSREQVDRVIAKVSRWDLLEVDFKSGVVKNLTTEEIIQGIPTPEDMVRMIEVGGLEADVRRNLEAQKASKST
jgi:hypothetical protein